MAEEQNEELKEGLTEHINLLKRRNKQMGEIVDIEKDLKLKTKGQLNLRESIGKKIESAGDGLVAGAEGFVSNMFGPGLG